MSGAGAATPVQPEAKRPGQAALRPSTDPPAPGAMPEGAEAAVLLRYRMARERPRNPEEGKARLLRHCEQPAFAALARYRKLVDGEWIDAPSIRFAEAALQTMGNILSEVGAFRDDSRERVIRIAVTDFESNVTHTKEVLIPKVIERAELLPGEVPLASRVDGNGQRLYTLLATREEILAREGALVSKALRQIALRLLPGDWVQEGLRAIRRTLEAEIAQDLESTRETLAQGFAALRMEEGRLKEYLGHDLECASASECADLQAVLAALEEGETTRAESIGAGGRGEERSPLKRKLELLRKRVAGTRARDLAPPAENPGPPSGEAQDEGASPSRR